jgi:phage terminase small subunit
MPLTPKQEQFVREYLIDKNATQSAIRAGYSAKTARQIGEENLSKPDIAKAIAENAKKVAEKAELSAETVLRDIAQIKKLALQQIPDRDGNLLPLNIQTALKACELEGKHLAMFTEKVQHSGSIDALTDAQVEARLAALLAKK